MTMTEFEIFNNAFERVRVYFETYEFESIDHKAIFIPAGDGNLELDFDGDGKLVDTIYYWRD